MPVETVSYIQESIPHMIGAISASLPCVLDDLLHWEAQLERERQRAMATVQRQTSAPLPFTSDVSAAIESGRAHTAPPSQDRATTSAAFVMIWSHFQHLFTSRDHRFGHALAMFVADTNKRITEKITAQNSFTAARTTYTTSDLLESPLNSTMSSEPSLPSLSLSYSSSSSSREEYISYLLHSIRSFLTCHYTNIIVSYPHLQETIICRKIAYYTLKSIVYDSLSVTLYQLYQYTYYERDELIIRRLNTLKQHFFINRSSSYTPTNSDDNSSNNTNNNNNNNNNSSSNSILLPDTSTCIVEALRHVFDSKTMSDKFSRLFIVCKEIAATTTNSSADVTATIMSSSTHQDEVINKFIHYLIPLATMSIDTSHQHHQSYHRLYSTTRLIYDLMDEFITNDEQRFFLNIFMQTINTLSMQSN